MISAGRLRHRVRIDRLTVTLDSDDGVQTEEWAEVATVPADIQPLSGRELIAADAMDAKSTARIIVRYRPDLTAADRLVHRGTVYNIDAVIPDADSNIRHMTLMVSSGTNNG
jgi:SPP1 family predicted phage head-tail adaptor